MLIFEVINIIISACKKYEDQNSVANLKFNVLNIKKRRVQDYENKFKQILQNS